MPARSEISSVRSYETRECEPCPTIPLISFFFLSRLPCGSRALRILLPSKSILPFLSNSPPLPDISYFHAFALRSYPHRTPHLFLSRSHPHDANTLKLIHKTSMYNHLLLSTVCECFSEVSFFYTPLYLSLLLLSLLLFHSLPFSPTHPLSFSCISTSFISCERVPKYIFFFTTARRS